MARTAKRRRRLWDTYWFPGFRPQPTVHGIFGDPKARVITLNRRSKKRAAGAAVMSRWAGTTGKFGGCVIFRAATLRYFLDLRYRGVAVVRGGGGGGVRRDIWLRRQPLPLTPRSFFVVGGGVATGHKAPWGR